MALLSLPMAMGMLGSKEGVLSPPLGSRRRAWGRGFRSAGKGAVPFLLLCYTMLREKSYPIPPTQLAYL